MVSRKYEVENHLGEGVFGSTYLARHIASGRHVTIKFLRPDMLAKPGAEEALRERFVTAKKVRHPALIRYGEINDHNGTLYITQEYFKSQSLRQVMDEYVAGGQAFTLQDACQITIKVLEALQVGHDAGLFHRDLKPENVLVHTQRSGPGGKNVVRTIKVTDLGVVDMMENAQVGDRYDANELDSPYLAPELAGFTSPGSASADVYSVGVMLYELLCGQVPQGTFLSPTQVREDLPEHIDAVIELAVSPDPSDRYPSARDMVSDLQRAFNLEMQDGPQKTSYRNVLLGLAAGVALLLVVGLYFSQRETPPPEQDAKVQDELLRKEIQRANPLPDEAIIKKMLEAEPDMVWVPGGDFVKGRLRHEDGTMASASEKLAQVTASESFYIDRYEFPNRKGEQPVGNVSWADATRACEEVGKRLCTSDEWEKACKGPENFIYSYGDTPDPSFCGEAMDEPYRVGDRENCLSGYGVYDMSGGFREWTGTAKESNDSRKVVKGGQRGNYERGTRCAFGVDEDKGYAEATMTFRCCKDP
ncbi:MAG: bifunctional serine/threonine-protein kinase/formylglycine-generating enzyme family protein [Myxococcota bacterium]|nr:bifunctional serine/threonine-protein kinase/formylglycine-generating enzyme family protein [Myxococcota bacterium]